MSKDVMDELANKLGGQKSQRKGYRDIINELQSSGLNQHQLEKKLNEEIQFISSTAAELENKSKFKDAANLYFEAGTIVKEVLDESSNSHHQWIKKASDCLVSLANEYVTWGAQEIDRAAASLSIANLIYFLTGDWNLLPAYGEFNEKYKDHIQQGKTATQSLWVPYDLVSSVTQLNVESLQRAESFAQTALLTQAEPAKTFHDAVQTVIANARAAMVAQMKLPDLETSGLLPKDIVFGENFTLNIGIINKGEGFAHDVKVTINKMDGLNLVSGSYSSFYKELEANSKDQNFKLEFVVPSGEGEKERLFDIKGNIEFFDVIGNKRINPIGPYPIIIRAFKKADELKEQLSKVDSNHKEMLDKYYNYKTRIDTTSNMVESFKSTYNSLKEDTVACIDKGEFVKAETGIELLHSLLEKLGYSTAELISEYEDVTKSVNETNNNTKEAIQKLQDSIAETDSILTEFEKKWKK